MKPLFITFIIFTVLGLGLNLNADSKRKTQNMEEIWKEYKKIRRLPLHEREAVGDKFKKKLFLFYKNSISEDSSSFFENIIKYPIMINAFLAYFNESYSPEQFSKNKVSKLLFSLYTMKKRINNGNIGNAYYWDVVIYNKFNKLSYYSKELKKIIYNDLINSKANPCYIELLQLYHNLNIKKMIFQRIHKYDEMTQKNKKLTIVFVAVLAKHKDNLSKEQLIRWFSDMNPNNQSPKMDLLLGAMVYTGDKEIIDAIFKYIYSTKYSNTDFYNELCRALSKAINGFPKVSRLRGIVPITKKDKFKILDWVKQNKDHYVIKNLDFFECFGQF